MKTNDRCPNQFGAFSAIPIDGRKVVSGPLNCNSLTCPICQIRLKKRLFKRILNGAIGEDCTSRHSLKFLTLTFGGKKARLKAKTDLEEYNNSRGDYEKLTIKEFIYNIMTKNSHKLIRALKKSYGSFHYFRVCELHKDGIPHLHILFAGDAVIPKTILKSIEKLWCDTYSMGYVKINSKDFRNKKHAISYMLKYITKDIQKVGKWKRVFSASRNALVKIIKKDWLAVKVYIGAITDKGYKETVLSNHVLIREEVNKKFPSPASEIAYDVMNRMLFQQMKI